MSKQSDGGPAFPIIGGQPGDDAGMSLRDYFASKAMATILSSEVSPHEGYDPESESKFFEMAAGFGNTKADAVAFRAYRIADAMLIARNQ